MKSTLCAALAGMLVLSACGKHDGAAAPEAGAADPALAASYRATLVAQLAGTYHGQCGAGAGDISVSPAGLVRATGFEHDLNGADVSLTLSRTLAQGQPAGLEVRTGGAEPHWAFDLVSGPGEWASVADAATTVKCEQVARLTALRPKALYPQVASFFTKAPASLDCAGSGNGQIEPGLQPVAPGAAGVTIGKTSLAFDRGIKTETVMFAPDNRTLTYSVAYDDNATLAMRIEADGTLGEVMWTGTGGGALVCAPPRA